MTGTISRTGVEGSATSAFGSSIVARVMYHYEVNGVPYEGTRIADAILAPEYRPVMRGVVFLYWRPGADCVSPGGSGTPRSRSSHHRVEPNPQPAASVRATHSGTT